MDQIVTQKHPSPVIHKLAYTGKLGELFAIYAVNLVLTILSLGMYRFWGKVRLRRYLWAHTLFRDEPFAYTGNGKELFKGFLKVLFCIFIPVVLLLQVANTFIVSIGSLSLFTLVAILSPYILFWVRRYRLSRSTWRGIRFQQIGNATIYMRKACLGSFLNFITLFYYAPTNAVKLLDYQINRIYFGTQVFTYQGNVKDLRKNYIYIWLIPVVLGVIFFAVSVLGTSQILLVLHERKDKLALLHDNGFLATVGFSAILMVFVFLVFSIAMIFVGLKYRLLVYHHVVRNTRLGNMEFQFDATFWHFFRLRVGNFFLKILSLWLLAPLATQRKMNFLCRHITMFGTPHYAGIAQAPSLDKTGEGWTHWLDIDALDF